MTLLRWLVLAAAFQDSAEEWISWSPDPAPEAISQGAGEALLLRVREREIWEADLEDRTTRRIAAVPLPIAELSALGSEIWCLGENREDVCAVTLDGRVRPVRVPGRVVGWLPVLGETADRLLLLLDEGERTGLLSLGPGTQGAPSGAGTIPVEPGAVAWAQAGAEGSRLYVGTGYQIRGFLVGPPAVEIFSREPEEFGEPPAVVTSGPFVVLGGAVHDAFLRERLTTVPGGRVVSTPRHRVWAIASPASGEGPGQVRLYSAVDLGNEGTMTLPDVDFLEGAALTPTRLVVWGRDRDGRREIWMRSLPEALRGWGEWEGWPRFTVAAAELGREWAVAVRLPEDVEGVGVRGSPGASWDSGASTLHWRPTIADVAQGDRNAWIRLTWRRATGATEGYFAVTATVPCIPVPTRDGEPLTMEQVFPSREIANSLQLADEGRSVVAVEGGSALLRFDMETRAAEAAGLGEGVVDFVTAGDEVFLAYRGGRRIEVRRLGGLEVDRETTIEDGNPERLAWDGRRRKLLVAVEVAGQAGTALRVLNPRSLRTEEEWRPQAPRRIDSPRSVCVGGDGTLAIAGYGPVEFWRRSGRELEYLGEAPDASGLPYVEPGGDRIYMPRFVIRMRDQEVLREFEPSWQAVTGHPDNPFVFGIREREVGLRGTRVEILDRDTFRPRFSFRIPDPNPPILLAARDRLFLLHSDRLEWIPTPRDLPQDPEAAER